MMDAYTNLRRQSNSTNSSNTTTTPAPSTTPALTGPISQLPAVFNGRPWMPPDITQVTPLIGKIYTVRGGLWGQGRWCTIVDSRHSICRSTGQSHLANEHAHAHAHAHANAHQQRGHGHDPDCCDTGQVVLYNIPPFVEIVDVENAALKDAGNFNGTRSAAQTTLKGFTIDFLVELEKALQVIRFSCRPPCDDADIFSP